MSADLARQVGVVLENVYNDVSEQVSSGPKFIFFFFFFFGKRILLKSKTKELKGHIILTKTDVKIIMFL